MPYKDPAQRREYQNQWMQRRRREWIAEQGPCVDCGSQEDLEVDHVDPEDKVTHRVWSWTKERRDAELAKCVVRCSTCHDDKSRRQSWSKRFCLRGHDTWVCGRDNVYRCRQCRVEVEYPKINEYKRSRQRRTEA